MATRNLTQTDQGKERWLPVVGYEGLYDVSDGGHVRSWYNGRRGFRHRPKQLKPYAARHGYLVVGLKKNGTDKRWLVHRLVLLAFAGPDNGRPFANHIDFDRHNNHISNLEWVTREENERHSTEANRKPQGERNGMAKLTSDDVFAMRKLRQSGKLLREIADEFDVGMSVTSQICSGNRWKHLP